MTSCWAAVPRVGHIGQPGGPWLEKAFPGRRHNQLKEIQTSRKGIRRGHRYAPSPVLASADTDSGDQRLVLGLVWPRDGWANCKTAICMSAERSRGVLPSVTGDWMEMPAWSTALHMAAKGGLQEAEGLGISWRWVGREDSCGCGEPGDRPRCTVRSMPSTNGLLVSQTVFPLTVSPVSVSRSVPILSLLLPRLSRFGESMSEVDGGSWVSTCHAVDQRLMPRARELSGR